MLQFFNEPDARRAAKSVAERLQHELEASKQVLWLVCGGSNIPLIVEVMNDLPAERKNQLTIMLTDERYGEPGHAHSNWYQLDQAGFQAGQAHIIPTLVPDLSLEETCKQYEQRVAEAFTAADTVIAQFGLGADGHIAGILPHSPAVTEAKLVEGYNAGELTRITITPPAIRQINAAYALVYGETKHDAVARLRDENLPLEEQPAQILKELHESYVYTDQAGDQS